MKRLFLQSFILLLAAIAPAAAQEGGARVVIAGATIPGVFDESAEGPYHAFFRDVVANAPVRVNLLRMPVKRITRSFFDKRVDCLYMATDDTSFYRERGYTKADFASSRPFNIIHMRAYTRRDQPLITAMSQLGDRLIAGDEGIHVSTIAQRVLPFADRILYTKTVDEAFELLGGRRVDVAIAYGIDADQYFTRAGQQAYRTDESFALFSLGEGVNCWPTARTRVLIEYLDVQIKALQQSGTLKDRYGFDAR